MATTSGGATGADRGVGGIERVARLTLWGLLLRLPALVLLVVAGLFAAHRAIWSVVVGVVVGVLVAFVLGRLHRREGAGQYAAIAGALAVLIGTAAGAGGAWMALVGERTTATVTRVVVVDGGKGVGRVDEGTARAADGTTIAGRLGQFRLGTLHVGDRFAVRYDPTGVVQRPETLSRSHDGRDALGGLVAVLVGTGLVVGARVREGPSARVAGAPAGVGPRP